MSSELSQEIEDQIPNDYWSPGTTIRQHLEQRGNFSQWIIEGVLCDSVTFVVGKPKSGKSRFVANLVARLSMGEQFLGQSPIRNSQSQWHVLIIGTEYNLVQEWGERIQKLNGNIDTVAIEQIPPLGEVPSSIYNKLDRKAIDLVVVDNAGGFIDPTAGVNSDVSVSRLKTAIQPFTEAGVPVIVIHHQGKEGRGMQGNTQYEAMARHILTVDNPKKDNTQRVKRHGNLGTFEPLKLVIGDDGVTLTLGESEASTPAKEKASLSDNKLRMIELACQQPAGLSKAEVCRRIAREMLPDSNPTDDEVERKGKSISQQLGRLERSISSTLQWDTNKKKYTNA